MLNLVGLNTTILKERKSLNWVATFLSWLVTSIDRHFEDLTAVNEQK